MIFLFTRANNQKATAIAPGAPGDSSSFAVPFTPAAKVKRNCMSCFQLLD